MSGHPLHGIKPQAERERKACDWGAPSGLYGFKLERPRLGGGREVHPTARFLLTADHDSTGRPIVPESLRRQVTREFPGWEPVFA